MPDVFIALEEAAAFESVSYKTLTQRIYRNPQQYKTKSQAREGGGKDQVLISTSSLSAKARKAWRAAQKVEGSEVIIDKRAQEAVPWYVTADLNQYTEANKKRFYEAVELAARVQDFIDYDGPDRTGYAERYALGLGISPQSLYRYMKNVLEANAWALKLEKEDGKSRDYFRALALCRKPKETGTFPSLTDEQKAIIENIWFDKRFAANLGTIEMLYERFELEAERREWEEYPSIKTVARYIKFLMGQRGAESARFLAANGTREWKNKRMMKGKRDATSLQVMEYVVGDEHTFDFWVQWTAPNGKIKAVRPKLVAWLDMRSRAIIGDVACVNANSQTLKESLVKMIYSNPGGVPHILHVDNGKDYTAKAMTGQNRKHRKINLDFAFDSETVGFYQSIGIQEVGRSLPYQPWDKPIERFFSTVCSKFSKWFESYTGTLTGSKTYAKRQKDIDQMLERGELLTMEEFFEVWTEWKNTKYHTRKHRGLSDAGEKWVTPIEMFENGPRYTFIDNLTGGKLSEIREKFSTAMSNIVQGISQKFTDARTAFSNGLNNIKNAVSGAVTWFFESGKRIVSTFANGIKSAFSSAVEAVKGGLQKIRNLLPFSDAKEGPLSTLTLSGQRTMTTYAHGLTLAGDAPAEAMNKSLQQVQGALDREPEKKIDLGGGKKDKDESGDEGGSGKGKQVIIHKLLIPVDLKKIKDLQQLLALLQEVEDYAAANEDGEPGDDEDAAPAPA